METLSQKEGIAHLCHHDLHWEWCYDYDGGVEAIKEKPENEQAARLKYFGLVLDNLLPHDAAWQKVVSAQQESHIAWWEADVALIEYLARHAAELAVIHTQLWPDCPWNGETMFTRKDGDGNWY